MEVSDRDGVVTVVLVGKGDALHGAEHVRLEIIPVTTVPGLNESAVVMGDKTVISRLSFTSLEGLTSAEGSWTIESAGTCQTARFRANMHPH